MMNRDALKHLWTEYNILKNWVESTNPRKFTIENSSFDELDESLPSTNENIVTITGLIYPTTEPFLERGLRIEIHVPITYPHKAPEIYMKTHFYHPNIEQNGKIWCSYLKSRNANESFSLSAAVDSVLKIIDQPESSDIHQYDHSSKYMYDLYENNKTEYNQRIKQLITIYGVQRPEDSSENDPPPKDAARNLLQYLDILYPNGVSINTVFNTVRNTAPAYKPEVSTFFEDVVGKNAEDFTYDLHPTYRMSYSADKIAKASWTQIKQMLTCIARAERLSMYQYAHAIEDNRIKWILLRLKELVEKKN